MAAVSLWDISMILQVGRVIWVFRVSSVMACVLSIFIMIQSDFGNISDQYENFKSCVISHRGGDYLLVWDIFSVYTNKSPITR